jgi:hypothetical protein
MDAVLLLMEIIYAPLYNSNTILISIEYQLEREPFNTVISAALAIVFLVAFCRWDVDKWPT